MAENFVCTEDYYKTTMGTPQGITKGEYYEVEIENIYDPSKFWIIVKFKELAIFTRYLKWFYDNIENRKSILKNNLKKNMMCMVRKGNMYYRSFILPVLLPEENQVRVFMIDFGYIVNISIDDVFHIFEKHRDVPRFAVRSSLAYICPTDETESWCQPDLKIFCEIIANQKIFAKVCEIDTERNILFTEIYIDCNVTTKCVNDILVELKVAQYNKRVGTNNDIKITKYKSKVNYPHLFPTFEKLESGTVPSSLWEKDLVKHTVPLDLLYKDYYQYQDINYLGN